MSEEPPNTCLGNWISDKGKWAQLLTSDDPHAETLVEAVGNAVVQLMGDPALAMIDIGLDPNCGIHTIEVSRSAPGETVIHIKPIFTEKELNPCPTPPTSPSS